jgi:hypothetical protein
MCTVLCLGNEGRQQTSINVNFHFRKKTWEIENFAVACTYGLSLSKFLPILSPQNKSRGHRHITKHDL